MRKIAWTRPRLNEFKKAYEKAKKDGVEVFKIDPDGMGEVEVLVDYAKYLIEYLDSVLEP